jgi:hypothetical protein
MSVYTREVVELIDEEIPKEVREAMRKYGWNELGIYEAITKIVKKCKKRGIKVVKN